MKNAAIYYLQFLNPGQGAKNIQSLGRHRDQMYEYRMYGLETLLSKHRELKHLSVSVIHAVVISLHSKKLKNMFSSKSTITDPNRVDERQRTFKYLS